MFVGVGASVTSDTPVLIRTGAGTRLTTIGEFVDSYYQGDAEGYRGIEGVQTLGFEEKDSKFKKSPKRFFGCSRWVNARGVYRHRVTEICEIHYLGGVLRTTGDHSVFVRTRNGVHPKAARDLKPGDVLVALPVKVRGEFSPTHGTPHSVRAHEFSPLGEQIELALWEDDPETRARYEFALEQQEAMSQQAIAEQIGVSQATVGLWQRGVHMPRELSRNYTDVVLPDKVTVTPALMKVFGYYTAEGRCNNSLEFVFGTHEPELHADCIALMRQIFGLEPAVEQTPDNATKIRYGSAVLGRFFARHCGTGAHSKHVPEFLWDLPWEFFKAYLDGWARGDGYTTQEGKLSITSVCQQLIRELTWLCAMHGIKAGVREWEQQGGRIIKNTPLPDGKAWNLIIGKTSNPFALTEIIHPAQGKKPYVRQVVVKPYDGYVYDLCGCDNEAFFGGEKPMLLHNSRVRDLFKTAKENSPCILFIDEIDAVGRMRGAGVGGGSDEREQTLNQILSEMDGFQPTESVIVMAATNRPDVLDSALLRPGRFDRHITVDRPTWQGRLAILKVHTRNKPLADDVNLEEIARTMIGMTGADLRNLTNEAALLATREGKSRIDRSDFTQAADRVLRGPKREEVLSEQEKRHTAYHEAGHALCSWLTPGADRPLKVSIIPRGRSLGVNYSLPEEERLDYGKSYFLARLVTTMGGRAADRLVYGEPYAGAEMDLKQATRMARYMVTHWGMSDRLGPMAFRVGEEHVFLGKEIQEQRDFSEGTAQIIDEEVQRILREADQRAYELLESHRAELDRLVEALLAREELHRSDIDELLGGAAAVDGQTTDAIFAPGTPKGEIPR
jgi:ATP-dependent metalloprotease FtsH